MKKLIGPALTISALLAITGADARGHGGHGFHGHRGFGFHGSHAHCRWTHIDGRRERVCQ